MKTSNKILTGLLVVIFGVPLILAATLKNKVVKGDFTKKASHDEVPVYQRSGSFTAFKTVKVIAPGPHLLTCQLKQSGTMGYSYDVGETNDSVAVFTSNDTLYIKYIPEQQTNPQNQRDYRHHLDVEVKLPAFSNLVVDGATVSIDAPTVTQGALLLTLKNNGSVIDASRKEKDESSSSAPSKITNTAATSVQPAVTSKTELTAKCTPQNTKSAMVAEMDMGMKALPVFKFL